MNMDLHELAVAVLLLVGSFFTLVGSIGLVRLPDFFMRLHGPTKATTLGVGGVLLAAIVQARGRIRAARTAHRRVSFHDSAGQRVSHGTGRVAAAASVEGAASRHRRCIRGAADDERAQRVIKSCEAQWASGHRFRPSRTSVQFLPRVTYGITVRCDPDGSVPAHT